MRPLPPTPIFDRPQARALGWSDSALNRALRSGRIRALRHGQLTVAVGDAGLDRDARNQLAVIEAMAAARACHGSVISHRSAALVHGLALLSDKRTRPALTVAPRGVSAAVGVELHRATLPASDVTARDGVDVTTVARTVVDLARSMSTSSAVVTLDSALHLHATDDAQLDAVVLRCWNWPGIRRAVRAIRLADALAESPLESVSRLVLLRLGLPVPTLQAELGKPGTQPIGRVDFYWDQFGVAGEADGAGKYGLSSTSLLDEKRRQERLEDLGLIVVRWDWKDTTQPGLLRARIDGAFERSRQRDRSGLCRKWSVRDRETGHSAHKRGQPRAGRRRASP